MIRIVTIVGTRPDTIKLAPVLYELKDREEVKSILCSSGQHLEMLEQALDIFGLKPDIELKVMHPNQTLHSLTSRLMISISEMLQEVKPDLVIVHGDTTTGLCGAISAFYLRIPVIHVEAGLRTHSMVDPFPEEFNRQAIARIADIQFAPTEKAATNLRREGVVDSQIVVTGNTVVDSLRIVTKRLEQDAELKTAVSNSLRKTLGFDYTKSFHVLITMHRRENIGHGILNICSAILRLSDLFPEIDFVLPVHLNPAVSNDVKKLLEGRENIHLLPPLPYIEFVALLSTCTLVITDSGGLQEESVSLGKAALVTRNLTERDEGVAGGLLEVVSTDPERIFESARKILAEPIPDRKPLVNPYGEIGVSKRLVDEILRRYSKQFD